MSFNYSGFFRLYATAPHLGRAILDVVVEPLRWAGLNAFVKAADLPVPVSELALILGFGLQPARPERRNQAADGKEAESGKGGEEEKKDEQAVPLPGCRFAHLAGDAAPVESQEEATQRCAQWLAEHGAVVVEKGERGGLVWVRGKWRQLGWLGRGLPSAAVRVCAYVIAWVPTPPFPPPGFSCLRTNRLGAGAGHQGLTREDVCAGGDGQGEPTLARVKGLGCDACEGAALCSVTGLLWFWCANLDR